MHLIFYVSFATIYGEINMYRAQQKCNALVKFDISGIVAMFR